MIQKKVILGDGLLGKEINKKTNWSIVSRKNNNFDLTDMSTWKILETTSLDTIINCIGFTETYSTDRQKHWEINYKGVVNLANFCYKNNIKLVHISTDFVYFYSKSNSTENDIPIHANNWYSYTKLLSDGYVQLFDNNLIVRCSHKEKPFKFKEGYINYIGNFDYVDHISELLIDLIKYNASGIYNVGTEIKTMYDLGIRTNENTICSIGNISESKYIDVTMDTNKMKNFLKDKK